MDSKVDEVFNLPDLKFTQFCEWKFQLNRGIYNNIDIWFYDHGVKCVIQRRKTIIQFLYFACSSGEKIKFGAGGLRIKLEEFWNQVRNPNLETADCK